MCKLFNDWATEIEEYCKMNHLDFNKAQALSKSWGKNDIFLQYYDKNKPNTGLGLLDETPMPIVLKIYKKGDTLEFKQTEFTKKYLSL